MVGRTLAHYRITAPLGAGGMGEVWRAEDNRLGRDVALKVLPQEMALDPTRRERFQREARALAALDHPNIVTVYSVEEADGIHFLTMGLVSGQSLDHLIPVDGLPLKQILEHGILIADALAAAHQKGIVHRDLKPANIMLGDDRRLKVLDFGLATQVESGNWANADGPTLLRTSEGVVVGTMPYMSPEQLEGRAIDHRTDIYSLGVVLHEMSTGTRPFGGPSAAALMSAILRDPPPAISEIRPALPGDLGRLVGRCLEKDRERRFHTATEVRDELETVRRQLTSAEAPRSSATAREDASGRPKTSANSGVSSRRSIVVLPFTNLSPDPENEYFSDGLTEEIIADLSKVRALSVISRTSAMQLKGAKKDVRTIGRELGVRYVIEGGVRKAGHSLRITAQLVDALTDGHLWGDKYSGTIDDVFEVQERVAREIVRALNVTLTSDEDRRLGIRPISDVRAFELYLQARQEVRRLGASVERGVELLARAAEIEGDTAPLQALLAWAKVAKVKAGINRDMRPLDEAAIQAATLLELAPDAPYGYALLGYIEYERGNLPQAVRHFRAGLDREPNDGDALFYMGISYVCGGQNVQAEETSRRFLTSDPLAPASWLLGAVVGWFTGQFDKAVERNQRSLELDPQNFIGHWCMGYTYAAVGRVSDAARHAAWLNEHGPMVPYTIQLLALIDGMNGEPAHAAERLGAIDVTPADAHLKFHLAESFAIAGHHDRALNVLEMAVDQGFYPYPYLADYCPFLKPLRATPGFAGILAKAHDRTDTFRASTQR